MAETIRVELAGPSEGADLVRVLGARGLTGHLVRGARRCEVEISYEHEETERLLRDVLAVLETRLSDHAPCSICVRVGERAYSFPQGSFGGPCEFGRRTRPDDPFSAGSRLTGGDEDGDRGVHR